MKINKKDIQYLLKILATIIGGAAFIALILGVSWELVTLIIHAIAHTVKSA
jgi:hypothetical protein